MVYAYVTVPGCDQYKPNHLIAKPNTIVSPCNKILHHGAASLFLLCVSVCWLAMWSRRDIADVIVC